VKIGFRRPDIHQNVAAVSFFPATNCSTACRWFTSFKPPNFFVIRYLGDWTYGGERGGFPAVAV
jgi:hypothetical protein